jgi:DNA invertase Pin-like site-specific DNA recombinase
VGDKILVPLQELKLAKLPELEELMNQLGAENSMVNWKLDCLGRSLRDMNGLVAEFKRVE